MENQKLPRKIIVGGLILSIGFWCYFQYQKHQISVQTESSKSKRLMNKHNSDTTKTVETSSLHSLQSKITCPKCGFKKAEMLPTEICLLSYTCNNCNTTLHPKEGDCCVFCSYGEHKCPSKQ
jgi:ABC-type nickel/cobalt efflux system permease component RcnA